MPLKGIVIVYDTVRADGIGRIMGRNININGIPSLFRRAIFQDEHYEVDLIWSHMRIVAGLVPELVPTLANVIDSCHSKGMRDDFIKHFPGGSKMWRKMMAHIHVQLVVTHP